MKQKLDKQTFNLKVRLSESEFAKLQSMMDEFMVTNKSNFIRNCLFKKEVKVVKMDSSMYKVIEWLTKIHSQYRAIGVNYNQTVKHINTCFGENKAVLLLKNLEKYTANLVKISEQIALVSEGLKKKYRAMESEYE
jgi:hypothetical protein